MVQFIGDIEMEGSLVKQGNSYSIRIPKALIDTGVLKRGEIYKIKVSEKNDKLTVPPEQRWIEFESILYGDELIPLKEVL